MQSGYQSKSVSVATSAQNENAALPKLRELLLQQSKLLEKPLLGPYLLLYEWRAQQIRELIEQITDMAVESVPSDRNFVHDLYYRDRQPYSRRRGRQQIPFIARMREFFRQSIDFAKLTAVRRRSKPRCELQR